MEPINTLNEFMICVTADDKLGIMRPPRRPITKDEALSLAAWLVVLADDSPEHERFQATLAAVEAT